MCEDCDVGGGGGWQWWVPRHSAAVAVGRSLWPLTSLNNICGPSSLVVGSSELG